MINNTILLYVLRRSKPGLGKRTHLTHGSLTESQTRNFGRSRQPCLLVIHHRVLLWFSLSRLFRLWSHPVCKTSFFRLDFTALNLGLLSHPSSSAPAGASPPSTYFHNAISSFLANAMIPTLAQRLLPRPNLLMYH